MGYIVMQKMSQGFQCLKSKVQGFVEGSNAKLVQFKRFLVEKIGKLLPKLGKIFKYIVSKLIQVKDLAVSMVKLMLNFVKTKLRFLLSWKISHVAQDVLMIRE